MAVQLFDHPLPIDPLLAGMMQDVNLPERQQKFANDGIAHGGADHTRYIRNRYSIT
jgi:hypothetical protein